jgi:hypothetical protein
VQREKGKKMLLLLSNEMELQERQTTLLILGWPKSSATLAKKLIFMRKFI